MASNKHTAESGKIPANGLSFLDHVAKESTASLALDSHGPNQMPIGVVKKSISTDRGKFTFD
tara:strand:+ start:41 stop:226 length:186 start_codon:yes stop_codon:yes gene_type:complete